MFDQNRMENSRPISVSAVATVLFLVIGIFALVGVAAALLPGAKVHRMIDLDRELNLVTFFSAWLLFACGWMIFRKKLGRKTLPLSVGFLAALFVFMGADECLKIHETLEKAAGIDWQILYLPLICAAGVGWFRVIHLFRGRERWLWAAGAVAWASSQLFEAAQWGWWTSAPKSDNYHFLMIAEEVLEMSGSALFLIAIYWATARALACSMTQRVEHRFTFSGISDDQERRPSDSSPRETLSLSGQSNR